MYAHLLGYAQLFHSKHLDNLFLVKDYSLFILQEVMGTYILLILIEI